MNADGRGRTSPPALYRVARILRRLGLLVLVLFVVYVSSVVYSGAQVRPSSPPGQGPDIHPSGPNLVSLSANVSVSNPGFYSINELTIQTVVWSPPGFGGVLASGSSAAVSVAARSNTTVPIVLAIPLSGTALGYLATHDARLPYEVWANATYARILDIRLSQERNLSWGAPFEGLSVAWGTPAAQGNGTVALPVNLGFSNHARFPVAGSFSYRVLSPRGGQCATGSLPVAAAPGASFAGGFTAYAPANCNPHGGTILVTYSALLWSIAFPGLPVP